MHLKLVSFKLCPFVQRSIITLNIKKLPYDIEYIDLANKPDWFLKISPTGKVPLLIVNDSEILFESAIINEFLDEQAKPYLNPVKPLDRAKERGWIDFAGPTTMLQYNISIAETDAEFNEHMNKFFERWEPIEKYLAGHKFFRGNDLCLVDATYAPIFHRAFLMNKLNNDPRWAKFPKTRKWGENLMATEEVKNSVVPDFNDLFYEYIKGSKAHP